MAETPEGWTEEGRAWLASRPAPIREKAEAYPPWQIYRIKETGQFARITSYSEGDDASCETCCVAAWYDYYPMPVGVFGMPFTSLVSSDAATASASLPPEP